MEYIKEMKEVIDYLDQFTIVASTLAFIFSFINYFTNRNKKKFDEQRIEIQLVVKDKEKNIVLLDHPKRQNLTRAEVQGLLSLLPTKENIGQFHYKIDSICSDEFFKRLKKVQENSEETILCIDIKESELKDIDFNKLIKRYETSYSEEDILDL